MGVEVSLEHALCCITLRLLDFVSHTLQVLSVRSFIYYHSCVQLLIQCECCRWRISSNHIAHTQA